MSLIIRQKIFALTDSYEICDDLGRPKYSVWTEFLTLGHHIHVNDISAGREVGKIDERIFSFLHRANVFADGFEFEIVRQLTFLKPKYSISNGWQIDGDFLGWDYEIKDSRGETVATVSKELFHLSDTYSLSVFDPKHELAALLCALTIDMMNCGSGE